MSRKPNVRALPALADLFPGFAGWPTERTQVHCLQEALRTAAARVRRSAPTPFYSQRVIARFFRVPMGTVIRACRALNAEGCLTSVRGSGMHVPGRKAGPRTQVRGVVGLPVWTAGFAGFSHWRLFFRRLEEELRRHHFVADFVFMDNNEVASPELAERLLEHHLDYVIWPFPLPASVPILERLAEGGVRTVVVDEQPPPPTSRRLLSYQVSYDTAYARGFQVWRKAGIREAIVIGPDDLPRRPAAPVNRALVRTGVLPHYLSAPLDLDHLPDGAAIVFPDDLIAALIGHVSAAAMIRLIRRARVMMINAVPIAKPPGDARLDLVRLDWELLAHRLARDLAAPFGPKVPRPVVVHARWMPQASVAQYADMF